MFCEEWDARARAHANFHCHHVVSETTLRTHVPAPGADTVIFLCGPPPMVDAIETTLKSIGHAEQAIILP